MVDCVELFIDTVDAPVAVVTWKKDCELVVQADLAAGKGVAVWNVHPPEDFGEGGDDKELGKSTDGFPYRGVRRHVNGGNILNVWWEQSAQGCRQSNPGLTLGYIFVSWSRVNDTAVSIDFLI